MFTWICQECGREVPPSYSECPTCAERKAAAAGPPPPATPTPPQPTSRPPAQPAYYAPAPPPPQATYAPPPPPPPPPQRPPQHSGVPAWLLVILAFAGLGIILGGVYYLRSKGNGTTSSTASAPMEAPSIPAAGSATHPYAKFLEVTGIRLLEEGSKVRVRFSAVNHSAADMAGLAIRGELVAASGQGDDAAVAAFESKIGSLGPYESKDFTVPATTKMRAYELPDWQFLKARFVITSPK